MDTRGWEHMDERLDRAAEAFDVARRALNLGTPRIAGRQLAIAEAALAGARAAQARAQAEAPGATIVDRLEALRRAALAQWWGRVAADVPAVSPCSITALQLDAQADQHRAQWSLAMLAVVRGRFAHARAFLSEALRVVVESSAGAADEELAALALLDPNAAVRRHPCAYQPCKGWSLDWTGTVRACVCARFPHDTAAAHALIAWLKEQPVELRQDHQCAPTCRGWDVVERVGSVAGPGFEVEACGDCGLYGNDDDALVAACAFILKSLSAPAEGP